MKLRNTFLMLALTAGMSLFITSCTTESTPPVTTIPTGVQVNSLSATSIAVRWTRDGTDASTDTAIAIDQSTGLVAGTSATAASPGTSGTITGLQLNKTYDIYVGSSSGRSAKITWATATRSAKITLYETADNRPGEFSGLVLGPVAHAASISGAEKANIDLVLVSTAPPDVLPFLSLQSASDAGSGITGGRKTLFGNNFFTVALGLDGDFYSTSFAGDFDSSFTSVGGFASVTGGSLVSVLKTADNHYARIEIVKQPDGTIWRNVTGPYRAIDVIVSYQPMLAAPYAGRPEAVRRGTNEPTRRVTSGIVKN